MSLCGFACCHCGKCGPDVASRFGITSVPGKCPQCGRVNGPRSLVCSNCQAPLEQTRTQAVRPSPELSKPSILSKNSNNSNKANERSKK